MFEEAFQPIAGELKQAQEIFRAAQSGDGLAEPLERRKSLPVFEEIAAEVAGRPGKWMRPGLFLLAARAASPDGSPRKRLGNAAAPHFGSAVAPHLLIAAAVEMIQNASLLHDDVLDGGSLRRCRATTNARWGNWAAVLYGDHLIATAFSMIARAEMPQAYPSLAGILSSLCMGEFLQEELGRPPLRVTAQDALAVSGRKTASFVAEVCALGFSCGGGKPSQAAEALRAYGTHLGLAYQIVDDVVDVVGAEEQEGKTLRTDMLLSRPTLALAYALEAAPEATRRLVPPADEAAEAELTALLIGTGALTRALSEAESHLAQANAALAEAADRAPAKNLRGLEASFSALLGVLEMKRRSLIPAAFGAGRKINAQEIAR
jgi:octaprenyl-diphosphate synthase